MKNKIFLSFLIVFGLQIFSTFSQDKKGLARVTKIQGVEAYFLSEPLREYDVVFDEGTGLKVTSILTGGLVNESVSDKATQFVERVVKEGKEQGKSFDAVIYTSGKKVIAVKFKTEGTDTNKGIGRVKKISGMDIFVLSEPLSDYDVVNQKGGGLKLKSALTGGVVNNSIEEDVEQFANRLKKDAEDDGKTVEAIVYSAGKSAIGAKYK